MPVNPLDETELDDVDISWPGSECVALICVILLLDMRGVAKSKIGTRHTMTSSKASTNPKTGTVLIALLHVSMTYVQEKDL